MTTRFSFVRLIGICSTAMLLLALAGCGTRPPERDVGGYEEIGKASYYAHKFHGRKTASGERYNKNDLTAAHPKLPFNTIVHVVNLQNGKSVDVRVNDRGPFIKGRIIDLSYAAAKQVGMIRDGVVRVKISARIP